MQNRKHLKSDRLPPIKRFLLRNKHDISPQPLLGWHVELSIYGALTI